MSGVGLEGGLNPYEYAKGNPTMYTDPSGLLTELTDFQLSNIGVNQSLQWSNTAINRGVDKFNMNIATLSYPSYGSGVKGYTKDGVPQFDSNNKNFHSYNTSSSCAKSGWCTSANAWEGLQRYPFPGAKGSIVRDESVNYLGKMLGTARTEVYNNTQTIINVALPSYHALYPGTVTRYVQEDQNNVYIRTHGEGTGRFGAANSYLANFVWGNLTDSKIYEWMQQR